MLFEYFVLLADCSLGALAPGRIKLKVSLYPSPDIIHIMNVFFTKCFLQRIFL